MLAMPSMFAFAVMLALYLLIDLILCLSTGRVQSPFRGRRVPRFIRGRITRRGRPERYWSYVGLSSSILIITAGYIAKTLV